MAEPQLTIWQRAVINTVVEAMQEDLEKFAGRYIWLLSQIQSPETEVWKDEM